jgi:hypothetical protein
MGLCLPVAPRSPSIEAGGKEAVSDVATSQLSSVGRAAVEGVGGLYGIIELRTQLVWRIASLCSYFTVSITLCRWL